VSFNLVTEKNFQDKTFKVYHRIVVWGNLADQVATQYQKGSKVLVQGNIENRSYEQNGAKRYITEINARDVSPMSAGSGGVTYDPVDAVNLNNTEDLPF
jgi:single-stranded DNA-binding protein